MIHAPTASHSSLWNESAEQAVLSAMMMDEAAIRRARSILVAEAFYRTSHRHIFSAAIALQDAGTRVDPLTIASWLHDQHLLDSAGGTEYLGLLLDMVPHTNHVEDHARVVADYSHRRACLETLSAFAEAVRNGGMTARDAAQAAIAQLLPFSVDEPSRAGYVHAREVAVEALDAIGARMSGTRGICTGYEAIDDATGGFREGELVIVGGAEKMGKSAVTLNIALNVASRSLADGGGGVGYVSAEMIRATLFERCLSWHSLLGSHQISTGRLAPDQFDRLVESATWIVKQPLWIDDEAEPSLADVEARASHLKATHPEIRLIVVDFLQLVHARERGVPEAQELKRVAYGLKRLAKRLKVVVIAPCQVNTKDIESLKDMRPQLKDLQGSSGMRQAADFIALLYRDGFYNQLSKDPNLIELRFAACRRTPEFEAKLHWNGPTLRVDPLRAYRTSCAPQTSLAKPER
jgi:replicative DNA helicase